MSGPGPGSAGLGREDGLVARTFRNERLWIASIGVILGLIVFQAFTFYRLPLATGKQDGTDFISFYTTGRMVWDGIAPEAYYKVLFEQHLKTYGQIDVYMSWAYPPQLFLVVAPFALLPLWLGYLVYTLLGFALFAFAVKKLAGPYAPGALAAVLPAAIINARSGQTGFWVAGLIGLFLLYHRAGKARAGLPLGLMVLKPHLAVGIGFLTMLAGRWKVVALAGTVVVATCGVATAVFGIGIWRSFATGVAGSSSMLVEANFPLSRMTSVFAFAYRLGLSPSGAMAVHAAVALLGLGCVAWLVRLGARQGMVLAAAVTAGLMVSPYSYDYDLCALAFPAALLLPELARRANEWELGGMMALAWIASANSQIMVAEMLALAHVIPHQGRVGLISLSAPAWLALTGWAVRILARPVESA